MKTNQFKTNLSRALGNYLKNTNYIGDIMRNGIATLSNPKWEDFEKTGIRPLINSFFPQLEIGPQHVLIELYYF